ncbi:hypothetical protein OHA70_29490 [Kribbella sp. NBC_00382]|uniref:hypothetical protein n=1 Tax=Kribbella sp. NBC_00382 TaxID=2975967 RepID=UPI002E24DCC3
MKTVWRAVGLFWLAPLVGEFLLGNQPVTELPSILLFAPMYGGGALLIREVARRAGIGWTGIVLLAAAYGLLEEGPIDQMLFNPGYLGLDSFAGFALVPGLGVSVSLVQGTVTLHTIWSICVPIALVEGFAPESTRPWLGRLGLTVVALIFTLGSTLLGVMQAVGFHFVASPAQFAGSAVAIAVLVVLAFVLGRRAGHRRTGKPVPSPLRVGVVAFAATSLYWVESEFLPDDWLPEWVSIAWWFVLFGGTTAAIVHWSRGKGWGPRHRLALATGALLTYAWAGYSHASDMDNVSLPIALLGNTLFALAAGILVLILWRRLGTPRGVEHVR